MEWTSETRFPYVGTGSYRLYRVGLCKECNLLLIGSEPIARDYCSWHGPGSTGKTLNYTLFSDMESHSDIAPPFSGDPLTPASTESK